MQDNEVNLGKIIAEATGYEAPLAWIVPDESIEDTTNHPPKFSPRVLTVVGLVCMNIVLAETIILGPTITSFEKVLPVAELMLTSFAYGVVASTMGQRN